MGTRQLEGFLMNHGEGGFSLIEAMLSVVILSVGLLGLGQLQVRLSMAANDLHTSARAYLLGSSLAENLAASPAKVLQEQHQRFMFRSGSGVEFDTLVTRASTERPTQIRIQVKWDTRGESRAIELTRAADNPSSASDVRWLLP
jgi:Tfp pilus assembly protein PilV